MSIQELSTKFKVFVTEIDFLLALIIVLTGIGGYVLGMHSKVAPPERPEIAHEERNTRVVLPQTTELKANVVGAAQFVASKNGTKYHLLWCPGAKQMKEENKVFFDTKEEAEKAGYAPAANCKGI